MPTPAASLLTTSEVAALLAVDPATVRRWVEQDRLAAIRLPSGQIRVRQVDVDALLAPSLLPEQRAESA